MNADTILRARALLTTETPLKDDCGMRCGAACCQPDEDGKGGVFVFPGEETLFEGAQWARVEAGELVCEGVCDRDQRPLACRIFPLTPFFRANGTLDVRVDARAKRMCPLARWGVRGMSPSFVQAVREALTMVASDPEGEAYLRRWQSLEEAYTKLW